MSKQTKAVGCLSAAAFFLMLGYEAVRTSSNTLFQSHYGTTNLAAGLALVPLVLFFALLAYNYFLSQMGPRRTLLLTSLLSFVLILGCGLAILQGSKIATAFLFVHREVYVVLLLEQYWSFLNSTLKEDSAKKWNGFFMGMMSGGAVLGGLSVTFLANKGGTEYLPLFSLIGGAFAMIFADLGFRVAGEPKADRSRQTKRKLSLGLGAFRENPMLRNIFVLVFATQALSTILVIAFQTELQATFPDIHQQSAFSGEFYALLNGVSFVLQFFVSPLALKFLGPAIIQAIIPFVHLATAAYYFFSPTLVAAGLAYLTFKALDYSLFRASKEILYIPLSFQARYRAKELIDVLGYRVSKGVTSGAIGVIQHMVAVGFGFFAGSAAFASGFWLLATIPILRSSSKKSSKD